MLRKLISAVLSVVGRFKSFIRWVDNPYTGDKIRRPFSQKIASTGLSLVIIPFHKVLKVTKDIAFEEVFNKMAHLVNAVLGIFSDLRRPGYNYLSFILRGIVTAAGVLGRIVGKTAKALVEAIMSIFR